MAAARPFPPSSQRIAEARAQGFLPRARLVGFASALLAVLAVGFVVGPRVLALVDLLLREPLLLAAGGHGPEAMARAVSLLRAITGWLAVGLLAGFALVMLGSLFAQGASFARLSSARASSFAPLRPGQTASVLFALGLCLLLSLTLSDWALLEPASLSTFARSLASRLALLTVACVVIDIAFARARFFSALWLTRREQLDEQRESFGAPEVRAARQQARNALREQP